MYWASSDCELSRAVVKGLSSAGLQEGVWPNLRQRSSLLGSERLVERERHGDLARLELDLIAAGARVSFMDGVVI